VLSLTAVAAVFSWRTHCWRRLSLEQWASVTSKPEKQLVCRLYLARETLTGLADAPPEPRTYPRLVGSGPIQNWPEAEDRLVWWIEKPLFLRHSIHEPRVSRSVFTLGDCLFVVATPDDQIDLCGILRTCRQDVQEWHLKNGPR
jgi:hypothetical protein